jgi:hypothetical protein
MRDSDTILKTKISKIAAKRLEKLAQFVEKTPHFNMSTDTMYLRETCGSAGCIAGTMCLMNREKFAIDYGSFLSPDKKAQSKYLDIPYEVWDSVCYDPYTHDGSPVSLRRINKRSAVRAIRRLARTGVYSYPNQLANY